MSGRPVSFQVRKNLTAEKTNTRAEEQQAEATVACRRAAGT